MFRIILLTLVTEGLTADSSFSQGHIKYSDASGAKVDWKLYAPYSQLKSQLQQNQRRDSEKLLSRQSRVMEPAAVGTPVGIEDKIMEPRYKPFSQVPSHLKQLLTHSYESRTPYVDPEAFLHEIPQLSFGQVIPRESAEPMEDQSRTQSTAVRAEDYRGEQKEEEEQSFGEMEEGMKPERNQEQVPFVSNHRSLSFDKSVPFGIQQLLNYQAQIPYNVIANHIVYKPVRPFVPEPLLEDEVGPYKYRSRVYYAVKNNLKKNNKAQESPLAEDRRQN